MRLMGNFECYINFVVETGDGYQKGYQAFGENWNYRNVCNEAFPDMASRALGDPTIQAYLQK